MVFTVVQRILKDTRVGEDSTAKVQTSVGRIFLNQAAVMTFANLCQYLGLLQAGP